MCYHYSRLGNCEVCAAQPARYACPKCEVKTCSLPCVQIHKRELNCDGIRNRTKFLPLSEMTAREFMSDYCFLEECTRYTEQRKQDRWKHQRELPVPLQRLRTAAKQRGIQLKLLQSHFSRRQQNTSFLDWKLSRLYWRVEWIFTHSLDPSTHFVDARCDEQLTLTALLTKYFNEPHKQLQPHQAAGIGQVSLWLRAEGVKRSGTRCFQLAPHKTLAANLAGKTIIEFPTIYVSYEQRPPEGLEAIDSGESSVISKRQDVI
ncbi:CG1463 [Drosophila busckii]|uniref:Box C/D snoRNA protein 1 n=1 Tax=Drosophila busckii TaxID=30019 RepID=A0A0M4EIA7_DROBS|nr:CG1463 [Drosophila busckii]